MTTATQEFRPSSIPPGTMFSDSVLQSGAKEMLSAYFVTYLAANGDEPDTEFSLRDFGHWMTEEARVNRLYVIMLRQTNGPYLMDAIRSLISDGYLALREGDEEDFFQLTEKYIDFFRGYAAV